MAINPAQNGALEADETGLLPRSVRRAVLTVVGLLLAGAVYLLIVRGPAILFDLARSAMTYCF